MVASSWYGLWATVCTKSPSRASGIRAKEIAQEKAAPAATRMNTTAVTTPVETAISGISRSRTARKTNTSSTSA